MKMVAGIMNASIVLSMGVVGYYGYQDQQAELHADRKEAVIQAMLETFDDEQRYCLTQNIFFEARNQSELGQEAVARVTLNRVDHSSYPNTICEVVWQNKQFSWTHDGLPDEPSDNILEQRAWEKAEELTEKVLRDYVTLSPDITDGAIMYHADYVRPYWADAYSEVISIDSHIFYR